MSSFLKRLSNPGIYISAIAFSLPLWPQATIALASCWLLLSIRLLPSRLLEAIRHPFYRWNTLLFLCLVLGLAWTNDFTNGWKELKDESYLLVFVLLFAGSTYPEKTFLSGRKSIVAGAVVASIACMTAAAFRFINSGSIGEFFYTSYSIFLHPTYFGFLLSVSCLFLLDEIRSSKVSPRPWKPYWSLFICLVSIAFLCSKVIYTGLILISTACFVLLWNKGKLVLLADKRLLTVAFSGALLILVVNITNNRLGQVVNALSETGTGTINSTAMHTVDSLKYNSTTIRMAQWKYAIELGTSQPVYGAGTGDEIGELRKVFQKHNDPYALLHFRHAHSHYLHYWMMLGFGGLILAIVVLFMPLLLAWQKRRYITMLVYLLLLLIGFTDLLTHATLGACFTFLSCFLFAEAEGPTEKKPG